MRERLIRTSTFTRAELVSTLRQPRLLLVLILGPFLVLFVFGLGYDHSLPALGTVVVGGEDELTQHVDQYIREEQPVELDYRGTTDDRDAALQALEREEVDLVVVLPDHAMATLESSDQAVIEVHQRSLDPVSYSQVAVAADAAVSQINDEVLERVVAGLQEETGEFEDELTQAREQLDAVRSAVEEEDLAAAQRGAGELADRFDRLAQMLSTGSGLAIRIGLGDDVSELEQTLRRGAEQLRAISEIEGLDRLDEAATTLDALDEAITRLRAVEPSVVVRPFEADVKNATPVAVTLDRYFAPGLVALMLQHIAITFAALALVRERQERTVELFQVAPVTTGERLAGKTIAFVLLGVIAAAGLMVLIVTAFGVPLPADWFAFVSLLVLTLLASLGIGFVVAAVSHSDSQAVQFSMLLLLTAIFFSGLFMPLERIDMPVEVVSWLMPATYAFVGMQDLLLLQQSTQWWLFAGLGAIMLVGYVAARLLVPRRAWD